MKGVMMPGVSAGSNHVGASEMCTPQVICPAGCVARAGSTEVLAASMRTPSAVWHHRFAFRKLRMGCSPYCHLRVRPNPLER